MRKVYKIVFRGYTYVPGGVTDWTLSGDQSKTIMAKSSLEAIDYLRNSERNRIEVQEVQNLCTVDLIVENAK